MNETQLRELILKAISEVVGDTAGAQPAAPVPPASGAVESGEVRDLSAVDFRQIIDVPTPANPEEFRRMRSKTVARIGVWRAGPRCHQHLPAVPGGSRGRHGRRVYRRAGASAGRDGPVHRADPL